MEIDKIDIELLNILQNSFPVGSRPFLELGRQLRIPEEEVLARIKRLKEKRYIRRLGGIFNSVKLGYRSTLCAVKVPEERLLEVAEIINGYSSVTHNYVRNHSFNLWFTLTALSTEKIGEIIKDIELKAELNEIVSFPTVKVHKIKTNFEIMEV